MNLPIEFYLALSGLVFAVGVTSFVLRKTLFQKIAAAVVMNVSLTLALVLSSVSLSELEGQVLGVLVSLFFMGWLVLFSSLAVFLVRRAGNNNTNNLHILRG